MEALSLKTTDSLKHFDKPQGIKHNLNETEKVKLAKTARDFESLLTAMMLKSMTSTTEGMFGEESYGGDYFDSIFQQQMAQHISGGKGFGVAGMIYKNITGENMPALSKIKINPFSNAEKIKLNINVGMPSVSPAKTSIERINRFDNIINEASKKFGVDKNLIRSVILAESAGKTDALSKANAKGLMQLIDSTAQDMGVENVWNPKENIFGGTKYLSSLLRQYKGDVNLALAGYNAGPGNVNKFKGIPPFEETRNYIARVIGYFNHLSEKI